MRYLFPFYILFSVLIYGCTSYPKNEYLEGTSITIGLYIPYNGTIYGLQAFHYLSGKRIISGTNELPKVKSEHIMTNQVLGCSVIDKNITEIR